VLNLQKVNPKLVSTCFVISETERDRAIVVMEHYQESRQPIKLPLPMTLSDLERRDVKCQTFLEDLSVITHQLFDLERLNLIWLYLVSFLRYSLSKNVVTLKSRQRSLKVIECGIIR